MRDARQDATGSGKREDPWVLKTAPGSSEYLMYRDESADPPLSSVSSARRSRIPARRYRRPARVAQGVRRLVVLGAADEQKTAARHSRGMGRSTDNPVGGWYGLKKGLRGRFGMYLPPLLEALGLASSSTIRQQPMRAI